MIKNKEGYEITINELNSGASKDYIFEIEIPPIKQ